MFYKTKKISNLDLWDLLEKVKTDENDHTSGFHLSEEHLQVESSDRQDVAKCLHLLSERTAACLGTIHKLFRALL